MGLEFKLLQLEEDYKENLELFHFFWLY